MLIETFHGSLDYPIEKFRIATHFGTPEQALSAIGAKRFLDEKKDGIPTLYTVTIDVPDANLFKVKKDWGMYGAHGALLPIRQLLEIEATPEKMVEIAKRFATHFRAINAISCEISARNLAEELLQQEANGTYKVLEYANGVESSGTGYCVLDPSLISIVSTSFPSWMDIIESFKNHGDWEKGRDVAEALQRSIQSEDA